MTDGRGRDAPRRVIPVWRIVVSIALALSLVGIALTAFWPHHIGGQGGSAARPLLLFVQSLGVPLSYNALEFGSNIALWIPASALFAVLLPPRLRWIGPVLALLGSTAVEGVQEFLLPGRTGDVRDIIANTSGAVIGTLLVVLVAAIRRSRSARRSRAAR